jgi:hypothetical protein
MSEVEEITQLMATDDLLVGWLKSIPPKTKVGNLRLTWDGPEIHFLWALGFHVLNVGLESVSTEDGNQAPCGSWVRKFNQDLLEKYYPKGSRLREVTAGECLSVLRPE